MSKRRYLRATAAALLMALSAGILLVVAGPAGAATPVVSLTVSPNPVAPGDPITLAAMVTDPTTSPVLSKVVFCFTDARYSTCDVQQDNTLTQAFVQSSGIAQSTSVIQVAGTYDVYATYYGSAPGGIVNGYDSNHISLVVGTAPALPTVNIGDASVREGNTLLGNLAVFPVTLSAPAATTVTATALTTNGTARTGSDYFAVPFPVRIAAGRTTAYVLVLILGDRVKEPDETFTVTLTNVIGATTGHNPATGTILNDD
jgi:Calx-beta domain-containing protein